MSQPQSRKRSAEQWQQLIEAQAASDQSQAAFCAERGLSKSTFQLWKRRLRASSPAEPALFTPLADTAPPSDPGTHWDVELDLGNGICLHLRRPTS